MADKEEIIDLEGIELSPNEIVDLEGIETDIDLTGIEASDEEPTEEPVEGSPLPTALSTGVKGVSTLASSDKTTAHVSYPVETEFDWEESMSIPGATPPKPKRKRASVNKDEVYRSYLKSRPDETPLGMKVELFSVNGNGEILSEEFGPDDFRRNILNNPSSVATKAEAEDLAAYLHSKRAQRGAGFEGVEVYGNVRAPDFDISKYKGFTETDKTIILMPPEEALSIMENGHNISIRMSRIDENGNEDLEIASNLDSLRELVNEGFSFTSSSHRAYRAHVDMLHYGAKTRKGMYETAFGDVESQKETYIAAMLSGATAGLSNIALTTSQVSVNVLGKHSRGRPGPIVEPEVLRSMYQTNPKTAFVGEFMGAALLPSPGLAVGKMLATKIARNAVSGFKTIFRSPKLMTSLTLGAEGALYNTVYKSTDNVLNGELASAGNIGEWISNGLIGFAVGAAVGSFVAPKTIDPGAMGFGEKLSRGGLKTPIQSPKEMLVRDFEGSRKAIVTSVKDASEEATVQAAKVNPEARAQLETITDVTSVKDASGTYTVQAAKVNPEARAQLETITDVRTEKPTPIGSNKVEGKPQLQLVKPLEGIDISKAEVISSNKVPTISDLQKTFTNNIDENMKTAVEKEHITETEYKLIMWRLERLGKRLPATEPDAVVKEFSETQDSITEIFAKNKELVKGNLGKLREIEVVEKEALENLERMRSSYSEVLGPNAPLDEPRKAMLGSNEVPKVEFPEGYNEVTPGRSVIKLNFLKSASWEELGLLKTRLAENPSEVLLTIPEAEISKMSKEDLSKILYGLEKAISTDTFVDLAKAYKAKGGKLSEDALTRLEEVVRINKSARKILGKKKNKDLDFATFEGQRRVFSMTEMDKLAFKKDIGDDLYKKLEGAEGTGFPDQKDLMAREWFESKLPGKMKPLTDVNFILMLLRPFKIAGRLVKSVTVHGGALAGAIIDRAFPNRWVMDMIFGHALAQGLGIDQAIIGAGREMAKSWFEENEIPEVEQTKTGKFMDWLGTKFRGLVEDMGLVDITPKEPFTKEERKRVISNVRGIADTIQAAATSGFESPESALAAVNVINILRSSPPLQAPESEWERWTERAVIALTPQLIAGRIANSTLTKQQFEALKVAYPRLYETIVSKVSQYYYGLGETDEERTDAFEALPESKQNLLRAILPIETFMSMNPASMALLQQLAQSATVQAQQQAQPGKPAKLSERDKRSTVASQITNSQRLSGHYEA